MDFVSKDLKTINLPVKLHSKVYKLSTSCNDICMSQKENFYKRYPRGSKLSCNRNMSCHTKFCIYEMVPTLENLSDVLND